MTTWVLLPGLDGTGLLFEPLLRAAPPGQPVQVVSYPRAEHLEYPELVELVRDQLPHGPFIVVAESYSGPVGIALAAAPPDGLHGLILVATFARLPSPIPPWLAKAALSVAPHRPPLRVARHFLLGRHPQPEVVALLDEATSLVEPAVLMARVHAIASVDVESELRRVQAPLAYLRATRDALVGRRAVARLQHLRPDLEVIDVDAPHLLLQTAPEVAMRHLIRLAAAMGPGTEARP